MTTAQELAAAIDHTLLKPDMRISDVERLCAEARAHRFAAVCLPPCYVDAAAELLADTPVEVATVVGFPLGYSTTASKVAETAEAVDRGATEIDVVVNISRLCSGDLVSVGEELAAVVQAARPGPSPAGNTVKVIIETAYLDEDGKRDAAQLVRDSGADFIKTSTGFAPAGASVDDVALLAELLAGEVEVKASGGIRTLADAEAMLAAGASRLGVSAGVAIIKEATQAAERGLQ